MTEAHSGEWQRLSIWAVLPLCLGLARGLLREYLPVLVGVGAGLTYIQRFGLREMALAALLVLLLGLLYALVWQRRFRFRIESEGLRVRSGILQRRELRLRWERVRNVDVGQVFYLRPLGLVSVVVETVGGEGEEARLPAVTRAIGEAIREQATGKTEAAEKAAESSPEDPDCLHAPSRRALFLHGVVSGQLWLVFAALGGLYGGFNEQMVFLFETGLGWLFGGLFPAIDKPWLLLLPALLLVPALLVVMSGLVALLRFYDYRLSQPGTELRASYGLLERRERSLNREKLQSVTLLQSLTGRWLGRCHLLGHQASTATQGEGEQRDGRVLIPALTMKEAGQVLNALDPAFGHEPSLQTVDRRFIVFWRIRLSLLVLILLAILWLSGVTLGNLLLAGVTGALALLLPVLGFVVARRWRVWGWALAGDRLHIRQGLWGWQREMFDIHRVQQVQLRQSPYLRRAGLVNLVLYLADGPRSIPFLPEAEARALANRVLYEVETAPIAAL